MFSKLLSFLCSIHIEESTRTRIQTATRGSWDLPVLIIALVALAVGVIGLVVALKALREAKSANKNSDLSGSATAFEALEPSDKEKVIKHIEELVSEERKNDK